MKNAIFISLPAMALLWVLSNQNLAAKASNRGPAIENNKKETRSSRGRWYFLRKKRLRSYLS